MKNDIATALAKLVGMPLWDSGRAADLQWFEFGTRRKVVSRAGTYKGTERLVGDYGIHIQCAWRLARESGIIVGSGDRFTPSNEENVADDWDWMLPGANRCDRIIQSVFANDSRTVVSVNVGLSGSASLMLSDGIVLEILPDRSTGEHWRLLRPYTEEPHLVVECDAAGRLIASFVGDAASQG